MSSLVKLQPANSSSSNAGDRNNLANARPAPPMAFPDKLNNLIPLAGASTASSRKATSVASGGKKSKPAATAALDAVASGAGGGGSGGCGAAP
eukprot:CAMPEP_0176131030 /NCGR_PEP_ID=MMETSP0120_2-20121206/66318_1 /TAXON_ID=160619 /ORGANISM="Kryptoperidinium foliaceum, Strain CCMP 1326" /LENGTH=92 /DNA_ID=CAMNT_0017466369 /DNA_START=253 /DNA_END=528 /DNA_ORIENTATION=+